MTRLALSTDALVVRMRKGNQWSKGSVSTLNRYISGAGEHKITPQVLGLIATALEWSDDDKNWVLFGDERPGSGLPTKKQEEDQWAELLAFMRRSTNLPYEVQQKQAQVRTAIENERYNDARRVLEDISSLLYTPVLYAAEEYARAVAAQGALAFTEFNYPEAMRFYGKAITIRPLSEERLTRYRNSFRIAGNATISQAADYSTARKVLKEMTKAGIDPNVVTYNSLIAQAPDYSTARKVLTEMTEAGIDPDVVTYTSLIAQAQDYSTARKVLTEMTEAGIDPDVVTYTSLIAQAQDYSTARKVLTEMTEAGIEPNVVTYTSLIVQAPDLASAELFFWTIPPAAFQCQALPALVSKAKTVGEGLKVIDRMVAVKGPLSAHVFATVVSKAETADEGLRVIDRMVAVKVPLSAHVFATVVSKAETADEGLRVIDRMVAVKVPLSAHVFATVVSKAETADEGLKVIDRMVTVEVPPSVDVFARLVSKAETVDEGLKVIDRMVTVEVPLSVDVFARLVSKAETVDEGLKVIDRMVTVQVLPSVDVFARLVSKAETVDEGLKVIDRMVTVQVLPSVDVFARLVSKAETVDEGLKVIDRMVTVQVLPSVDVFARLVSKAETVDEGLKVIDRMVTVQVLPSVDVFARLVSKAETVDEGLKVIDRMFTEQVPLGGQMPVAFLRLVKLPQDFDALYGRLKNFGYHLTAAGASAALYQMCSFEGACHLLVSGIAPFRPDEQVYGGLMSNARSCCDVCRILRMMRSDGIPVGRWSWNAYAQTLTSFEEVKKALNAMSRRGFPSSYGTILHLSRHAKTHEQVNQLRDLERISANPKRLEACVELELAKAISNSEQTLVS